MSKSTFITQTNNHSVKIEVRTLPVAFFTWKNKWNVCSHFYLAAYVTILVKMAMCVYVRGSICVNRYVLNNTYYLYYSFPRTHTYFFLTLCFSLSQKRMFECWMFLHVFYRLGLLVILWSCAIIDCVTFAMFVCVT